MSVRERAISAIQDLPEDAGIVEIMRELSFLAGIDEAVDEIDRGLGVDAGAAKQKLREWITG